MSYEELLKAVELLFRPPLGSPIGAVWTHKKLHHTRNLFGTVDELSSRCLKVIERNPRGDCFCLIEEGGQVVGLVDVDYRDTYLYLSRDLKTAAYNPIPTRVFDVDAAGVARMRRY